MTGPAIGVDIGGTHLRAALVDEHGRCQNLVKHATANTSAAALIDQLSAVLQTYPDALPVGVAIAGLVGRDGVLHASPNLPQLRYPLPLAADLAARVGRRVTLENDASAAAFGEHACGAAATTNSSLLITIGTGVGAGIVVDGQVLRGVHGYAGEVGHMLCDIATGATPKPTSVEQVLSATAIASHASMRTGAPLSTSDVIRAAQQHEPWATALLEDTAVLLGATLANMVNVLDVAVCVIGGGAGVALFPFLQHTASDTLRQHLLGSAEGRVPPPVRVAALGDTAGVIGVALLAQRKGRE